jgi:hypothetical protein
MRALIHTPNNFGCGGEMGVASKLVRVLAF